MKELKFFGRSITIGKVENKSTNRPKSADIIKKIVKTQLVRTRQDASNWRSALNLAESVLNPNRTDLIKVYREIELDAHLTSLMETLKLKIEGMPFYIQNESGEVDEDTQELFKKKWFRDFCKKAVNSKFYGFELVSLGDIVNDIFSGVETVRHEYVIPEKRAVKKELYLTKSLLVPFDKAPFDKWTIFIHDKGDLGLLNKAAPLALYKRHVLAAWSEAAEIFGMPFRAGKTQINSPEQRKNMENMLQEMGTAAWGVFDIDDELEFIQTTKTDFHQIYDSFIARVNSEMSKLMLGQTMSSDDGSSRSQAEVHERVLNDYEQALKTFVSDVVNDQLIPLMVRHGMIPFGTKFVQDNEEKIDIKSRFEMVKGLLDKYDISPEYIEETFGIPVEEKETPDPLVTGVPVADEEEDIKNVKSVMASVEELYSKVHVH